MSRCLAHTIEDLVAGIAILVAVFVCLTEVALKHFAVAETGTIVLRCFLVGTLALVAIVAAFPAIFAALFDASPKPAFSAV